MNSTRSIAILASVMLALAGGDAHAQTRIAKEQIEDAFLLKSGGSMYGDLRAATSTIQAETFEARSGNGLFSMRLDEDIAAIRSNKDLLLDPTNFGAANGKIIPATVMEYPDDLGDKIRFYSHSYAIGVSPFDLDFRSDMNFRFHSDTSDDLFAIMGDAGDVHAKRDVYAGRTFRFADDLEGDKILLFGGLYRMAISEDDFDFYSDVNFRWHSDTASDAMALNADTGRLSLSGPLRLPIYSSLPGGVEGDLIYFDHPSDNNQDGAYVYAASGWVKL